MLLLHSKRGRAAGAALVGAGTNRAAGPSGVVPGAAVRMWPFRLGDVSGVYRPTRGFVRRRYRNRAWIQSDTQSSAGMPTKCRASLTPAGPSRLPLGDSHLAQSRGRAHRAETHSGNPASPRYVRPEPLRLVAGPPVLEKRWLPARQPGRPAAPARKRREGSLDRCQQGPRPPGGSGGLGRCGPAGHHAGRPFAGAGRPGGGNPPRRPALQPCQGRRGQHVPRRAHGPGHRYRACIGPGGRNLRLGAAPSQRAGQPGTAEDLG